MSIWMRICFQFQPEQNITIPLHYQCRRDRMRIRSCMLCGGKMGTNTESTCGLVLIYVHFMCNFQKSQSFCIRVSYINLCLMFKNRTTHTFLSIHLIIAHLPNTHLHTHTHSERPVNSIYNSWSGTFKSEGFFFILSTSLAKKRRRREFTRKPNDNFI